MMRRVFVSLPCESNFMKLIGIVHVSLQCTDPDWNGAVREQTNIHLFPTRVFIFLKVLYL